MTAQDSTKTCTKCKHTLPYSVFHQSGKNKDGLQYRCKDCDKALQRKWTRKKRVENDPGWIEKKREKSRRRAASPAGKLYVSKYRTENKEKCAAHCAVQRAIRMGELPIVNTLKCEICGNPATEYHHHLGYTKEHHRDVQQLCRICHKAAHAEMKLDEKRKDGAE